MAKHSVVFNMRVQLPGTQSDGAGQVSYEQMMNTFDRTRREGEKEGWQKAIRLLRKAADLRSDADQANALLDELVTEAARQSPWVEANEDPPLPSRRRRRPSRWTRASTRSCSRRPWATARSAARRAPRSTRAVTAARPSQPLPRGPTRRMP